MVATVRSLCKPNETVFDDALLDRVERLEDFVSGTIDPNAFFAKNHMTEGLKALVGQGFERLSGKSQNAVFYLTQSMGGGKTHSIIALGLLAQDPELRGALLPERAGEWTFGKAKVVAVNGRDSFDQYVWGYVAERLGKAEAFTEFHKNGPKAPAPKDWKALLGDEPVIIMFDELPTYLQDARSVTVGNSDLADVTGRALANLLDAVASLPRVCVVVTDLVNTYREGSKVINDAIRTFEGETNRQAVPIAPVQLNSDEIFQILRKRIFSGFPPEGDERIEEVAEAYVDALKKAKAMDLVSGTPESIKARVHASYPFHPSVRDICARFRENRDYQQTRDLISLMRLIARAVWSPDRPDDTYLIGLQHIDLNNGKSVAAVKRINGALDNAISRDIAAKGAARAERIDDTSGEAQAVPAASLLLMSSLSTATDPVLGLTESELTECLVAPLKDASKVRDAVEKLRHGAWYLHKTRDGKFYFSNTENVVAKLQSFSDGYSQEVVTKTLRTKLEEMFKPTVSDLYQRAQALPAQDEIVVEQDKVTLVIVEPHGKGLNPDAAAFYASTEYKNRLLFLTGDASSITDLDAAARSLKAAEDIIKEFEAKKVAKGTPQMEEAENLHQERVAAFGSQVRETFKTLHFPTGNGLRTVAVTMTFTANKYDGEEQIRKALTERKKFYPDVDAARDTLRDRAEEVLFTAKSLPWSDAKRNAALEPSWVWMPPKGIDHLKTECVDRKEWREHTGGYVEKPPFAADKTSVIKNTVQRDPDTGECRIEVSAKNGDRVHWATSASISAQSPVVEGGFLQTRDTRIWLLATDSTGKHETGDAVEWRNDIEVRIAVKDGTDARTVILEAIPGGAIRYTTDHSDPISNGQPYSGPFEVGDEATLVQAVAELDGIRNAKPLSHRIPARGAKAPPVDPNLPARWRRVFKQDGTEAVYALVKAAKDSKAEIHGVTATTTDAADASAFMRIQYGDKFPLTAEKLEANLAQLREICPTGELQLHSKSVAFETGTDLTRFGNHLGIVPAPEEVSQ